MSLLLIITCGSLHYYSGFIGASKKHMPSSRSNTHQSKNMADITEINYIKLAQFETIVSGKKLDNKTILVAIERLINQGLDVNYRLKPIAYFKFKFNHLGSTVLHLALEHGELEVFCSLLEHGADFTIENGERKTVVHQAMDRSFYRKEAFWKLQGKLKHPFIDAVLKKQMNSKNSVNPCSKDGLTHFHAACMTNNAKAVEFFLKNGAAVNKAIEPNSKILPGYTPLHLAVRYCALEAVGVLLDYNANLHFKNIEGMNPLHMLIERTMQIGSWLDIGKRGPCEEAFNQFKMNQKVLQQLFNRSYTYSHTDYIDDIDFSCLHVGCFTKDSSIVKALFERGYNMTQAVKRDSPIWPGYTALHFAVQCRFEVTMYLLEQGADVLAKDAKGVTPFDLILQLYKPELIHSVILSQDAWKNIVFSDAKTKLADLVLAMGSQATFESFLKSIDASVDIQLPADSPIWPGFTPLHLAVIFPDRVKDVKDLQMDVDYENPAPNMYHCSEEDERLCFDRIKVCINLGADITVRNAEGSTPLHLAFERRKDKVVYFLMQLYTKVLNPVGKTGVSHFHIACAARDILLVNKLLLEGIDVNGRLPLSLSYQRIYQVEKSKSTNNLTVIEDENAIQFRITFYEISSKRHVFHLTAGSTPLHIAVAAEYPELMETLLKEEADIYAKDNLGFTPLHRMLTVESPPKFANCLESLTDLRDVTLEYGLSHLHIACLVGSEGCVKRLLERGANVEASLIYGHSKFESQKMPNEDSEFVDPYDDQLAEPMSFLAPFSGYRPLHFAVRADSPSVVKVLLERGADILAKSANGSTPLYDAFADEKNSCCDALMKELKNSIVLQKRVKEETGLTVLHFLCFLADVNAITDHLIEQVDVNARARDDSPLWAGYTPLHVLMRSCQANHRVDVITTLMLGRGADVSAVDIENESPIHMAYSRECCHDESEIRVHSFIVGMLKAQKDFSINPVSSEGISHFHIACMWDVEDVVEKFLRCGVDPNDPIDYFKKWMTALLESSNLSFPGGSSPLQLALIHKSKKVFNLLLKWGVNLGAVDRQGRTALHVAAAHIPRDATYFEEIIKCMKRFFGYNFDQARQVDLNVEDVYGTTPFEMLLDWNTVNDEIVKIFIKEGCRVNAFNTVTEEGYISFTIPNLANISRPRPAFELLMEAPTVLEIDRRGRNAIHNAVSLKKSFLLSGWSYVYVIERLVHLGCDIDLQDCSGKTPLHLAMQFRNYEGTIGLLECGANINILDPGKNTAFSCARGWTENDRYEDIIKVFMVHVHQSQLCGLYVNQVNIKMYRECAKTRQIKPSFLETNHSELAKLKEQRIGEYLVSLRDFLSETGAVTAYPHMIAEQRQAIDEFFKFKRDYLRENFRFFTSLLLLQYGKARKRGGMLEKATLSLNVLVGLEFPYLCSKSVLKFLSNNDLHLLVASTD